MTTTDERYTRLPLTQIIPSKTNPRKHFDEAYLAELAASITEKGVVQPILVRQIDAGSHHEMRFQIVAGECRYRASKIANVPDIPAVIRQYTDGQVLELQLIENIHRRDLTPLEQAAGYRALITTHPDKHSAASIATRIGMSEAWVWDRLKLNDLIPAAKTILERQLMTVGHAILIARLKPADQTRVIAIDDRGRNGFNHQHDGLWEYQGGGRLLDDDADDAIETARKDKYAAVKAVSVRELDAWIRDHVRFDVAHAAKAQPLVFEPIAAAVAEAEAKSGRGKKVIPITFSYRVADDARDEDDRTYGSESWRRADGQEKSKTCDYSVLGTVVAGVEHYGETFTVCVARDKCEVHFGKVIAAKKKNATLRAQGKPKKASQNEAKTAQRELEKRQRAARRWQQFRPAITKAVQVAVGKLPATLPKAVFKKMLASQGLPASTTPAQLQKALLQNSLKRVFSSWASEYTEPQMVAWAKALGVDLKTCEPKPETAAPAKKAS